MYIGTLLLISLDKQEEYFLREGGAENGRFHGYKGSLRIVGVFSKRHQQMVSRKIDSGRYTGRTRQPLAHPKGRKMPKTDKEG